MTGFGEAQAESGGYNFLLEIKSLNNRFLKTTVRLPDALSSLEPEIEKKVRNELLRGSVSLTLHMKNLNDAGPFEVNHAATEKYLASLLQLATLHDQGNNMNINLANLLQLPGVCQIRTFTEEEYKHFLEILLKLTDDALAKLQEMREIEGKVLLDDLQQNCKVISDNLTALSGLTDKVLNEYRNRIQSRVDMMLAEANIKLDEDMLMKEVAIFAERSDVNEEISRLQSHLEQFDAACQSDKQTGRRLDFITQEMLREANTIANKANDAQISQHVVEIKVAIDRLKEQVQNIE